MAPSGAPTCRLPRPQPEKVLSLPLQLRFSNYYRYTLAGTERVGGIRPLRRAIRAGAKGTSLHPETLGRPEDLHSCKGLLVDPERSPVERASLLRRLESHDVTVICTDPLGSGQRVAVVVREPQLKWKREHLLGLQQGKRRPVGTPLGAIDRERQLLPLDAVAGDKVPVGGDDVIPGSATFGLKCCAIRTFAA